MLHQLARFLRRPRLIRRGCLALCRPEVLVYVNEAQDLFMCNFNRLNETFFEEGDCWRVRLCYREVCMGRTSHWP